MKGLQCSDIGNKGIINNFDAFTSMVFVFLLLFPSILTFVFIEQRCISVITMVRAILFEGHLGHFPFGCHITFFRANMFDL